jgi:hypothetical protein
MGVFWLVLLGLIVWLVMRLLPDNRRGGTTRDTAAEEFHAELAHGGPPNRRPVCSVHKRGCTSGVGWRGA